MAEQAPNIDLEPGSSGKLVYDKARRAIVRAVPPPAGEREAYEKWQLTRYVTVFNRNPVGTWGDESGDKYAAPFVQAGWEAWQASARRSSLTAA